MSNTADGAVITTVDGFAVSLQEILNATGAAITDCAIPQAIEKGAKVTKDEWNKATEQFPTRRKDKPYRNSIFISRVRSAYGVEATIRSKQYQLVHLLEKGHKTPAGTKKVKAHVHVKPAAEKGKQITIDTLSANIDRILNDR